MSDNGPQINMDLSPDFFSDMARANEMIKAQRSAVRAAEREIAQLTKKGKDVPYQLQNDLRGARQSLGVLENARDAYMANKNREAALVKAENEAHRMENQFARSIHGLRMVMGGALFQKLASGERIMPQDVIREGLYSQRLVTHVGKAVGMNVREISKLHPWIYLLAETAFKAIELRENQKRDRRFEMNIEQMKARGMMNPALYALYASGEDNSFTNMFRRLQGIDVGKAKLEKNAELSQQLTEITEKRLNNVFNLVHTDRSRMGNFGKLWTLFRHTKIDEMTAAEVKRGITGALADEKHRLHAAELNKETQRLAIEAYMSKLGVSTSTPEFQLRLKQALEGQEGTKFVAQNESQNYHKKHRDAMYQLQFSLYNKRVPPNPTD